MSTTMGQGLGQSQMNREQSESSMMNKGGATKDDSYTVVH